MFDEGLKEEEFEEESKEELYDGLEERITRLLDLSDIEKDEG